MKTVRNQTGALSPVVLVLIVAVIAVAGFAGYRVMQSSKDKDSSSSATPTISKAESKALNTECLKEFDDKDFCKFASNWTGLESYNAVFASKDAEGVSSTMNIKMDGKNSSTVMLENGKEVSAYITLDGTSYMKDSAENVWYKLPATQAPESTDTNPTEALDFDLKEGEEKDTATYKKIGKEPCGNLTCFKYQIIDPADTETLESFVWFDDKDYKLARWTTKSKDGSTSDSTFTYGKVSITAPSPVKDYPTDGTFPGLGTQ